MPQLDTMIAVPGGQLRVVADGDGPPIVLVHSAIVDLRGWDPIVPALVDAGYRAIRYDTRGFGSSATEDVAFSNRADLIAVADAVGARQTAVVGNSRGAIIALDTVLEFPERFVAFVWVGGGVNGFDGGMEPLEEALEQAYEAAEEAGDADRMADLDLQLWVDGPGQPPTRVPAALREAVRAMDRPQVEPGRVFGKPIPLAPPGPPANERLDEVRVPTLAVVGALDTSGTRRSAARLAEGVGGARLVEIPNVAHLVGMEAPVELANLIVEHLAPLPRWA